MPTIPSPGGFVQPSAAPTPFLQVRADPASFGGQVGQAAQQAGDALGRTAQQAAQYAMARTGLDNETAAKDAWNTATQASQNLLWDPQNPQNGLFGKQGKNAVDAAGDVQQQLQTIRQNTLNSLPSDEARVMFDQSFTRNLISMQQSVGSYVEQQRKVWQIGASNGRIAIARDVAANFYNDPGKFADATQTIKGEVLSQGEMQGWSPEQVAAAQTQEVSKAWGTRIEKMALDNPIGAQDLYRQNMTSIDAAQQPALERMLDGMAKPEQTRGIATAIMNGRGIGNLDALTAAQAQVESGGKQLNADGTPVMSPKGAAGIMGVMPDTAKQVATSMGLAYDPQKLLTDAAYNQALGKEYMRQMMARYSGNQTMALAAYNAGPGRVDQWVIKNGDPRMGAVSDADWAQRIPMDETRNYVAKINGMVPPPAGVVPTSTDVREHLPDWVAQGRATAQQLWPNRPDLVDQTVGQIMQHASQIQTGAAYAEKQSRDTLLTQALGLSKLPDGSYTQVPNAQRPGNLEQLLQNPDAKKAWSTADPIQQQGLLSLLDHNAKDTDPPVTDTALSRYYELKGQAARDPAAFANQNLANKADLDLLPHHLTLDLINTQASLTTRQARDAVRGANLDHGLSITKPMLLAAGIPLPTKPGDKAATYDQFVGRLDDSMQQFVKDNKRTPNDDDIRKMGSSLLTQGAQSGTGGWIFGDKTVKAFQAPPGQFYTDPPPNQRGMVQDTLRRQLGHAPTDAEVRQWWTQYSLNKGGQNGG